MKTVTFITGNQNKADYLAKYLGHPVEHQKVDLDEIQSLELREIVEHKAKQAYDIVQAPVLVEDGSLEFTALGRLPGTFIKFFDQELESETMCRMIDGMDRSATGRVMFGYYDGEELRTFESELRGKIAEHPAGENGFGWDKIFIPEGYDITRAQLDDAEYEKVYRIIRPIDEIRQFLEQ
jgi:non-canonical purine NTP pyrophosphatase (RdgB/HAM1 family)